ncbi:MAG TPA: bifunctional hydroxymethylpyrimidine kinase/phosphomethylpyrimidine kinase, partial [Zeimonas sp.]|nr:bifunctional hydroxymethylpyrimidine kinase/phosphomethylpyrimidine kinase [Zeimonas sp.]
AVRQAKQYLTEALRQADRLRVGSGHGPVHHFHAWWPNA